MACLPLGRRTVQDVGCYVRFADLIVEVPRLQPVACDRFPASEVGFDPPSVIVTGCDPPGRSSVLGDMPDMPVPLAIVAGNCGLRGRDDDIDLWPECRGLEI